ncbi:MAG: nucleoside hydrolase [Bryobacteraceae bacterium]|nr:nucleoside hydrolase [Bryobacteraceae bacterium]MCX7604142.1 nucleoside hydrolase [Bryobacteraceae bacterium]
MKKQFAVVLFCTLAALAAPPVPVIYDTDMGNDIDDALALAMLHALDARGEIRLLAVTVTKDNPWAARYVSAVNRFYGRGDIPVGLVREGVTREEGNYVRRAIEQGGWPHDTDFPEAVGLLRRVLAEEADGSVVLVQVGFSTNLARLLDAPGGRELASRKVKLLSVMAGDFTGGGPEYNVKEDIPSARKLAAEWPGPIVWSGFEVGKTIRYPARSIERDFAWTPRHPVVDGYRLYMKFPYDRETWDLTAVLYAARPTDGYFTVSGPGWVRIDERGMTRFEPDPAGRHRHLIVDDLQRARALEAMVWLASQPARDAMRH